VAAIVGAFDESHISNVQGFDRSSSIVSLLKREKDG
jgi:hypothetical protein